MQVTIVDTPWVKTLYGLASVHTSSRSVGDEIRELLSPVWEAVRSHQITTTGINHVVYEANGVYFCGLEVPSLPKEIPGLTKKQIELPRYVYCKHIGPYEEIPKSYALMDVEMEKRSLQPLSTSVEIYGHWNDNQALLETELLIEFKEK